MSCIQGYMYNSIVYKIKKIPKYPYPIPFIIFASTNILVILLFIKH